MLLGAYYYLWYGRPTLPIIGGGVWKSGYTNNPVLGEYNSRDEAVINKHVDWAKEAGIDFFAVCWANIGTWDDITLKDYYLKNPKTSEIKFCLLYDSIQALNRHRFGTVSYNLNEDYMPGKTKGEKMVEDFDYFADNYFKHDNYLKINGDPVVILYAASAFKNTSSYLEKIVKNMENKGVKLFLVADVVCWAGVKISKRNFSFLWENSPKESLKTIYKAFRRLSMKTYEQDMSLNRFFKAITGYNMYSANRMDGFLNNVDETYKKFSDYAKTQKLYFFPNFMPGYDDKNLMGFDRPIFKRNDGKFYKDFWKISKKYLDQELPVSLITTFNEWHEGSEIEPSKEYGDEYLKITKEEKESNPFKKN